MAQTNSGFSRCGIANNRQQRDAGAKQAAEKLNPEGDGGFNPRIKPIE
jgi:hypothetical protein